MVTGLMPNCVKAVIITGEGTGQDVLIPRIPFKPTDSSIPFRRLQLPLSVSFAFTQHKSQGQTLRKAIVDLVPVNQVSGIEFAYVPLSRVRKLEDLTILRPFDPSVLQAKVNEACAAMMEEFKARDLCKDM